MIRFVLKFCLACAVLAGTGYGALQVSRSTTFQIFGEAIARVETDRKIIALTLDDGPAPKYLDDVLDTLRDLDIPATFYLVGNAATQYPGLVRQIAEAGHEIGNHSYTHPRLLLTRQSRIAREIEDTDAALRAAGYSGPISFRPPYGKKLLALPWYLSKHDRPSIMWSIAPEHWEGPIDDRAARIVQDARPGDIILLHVMWPVSQGSRDLLTPMVIGLKDQGFEFVTVSELLASRQTR